MSTLAASAQSTEFRQTTSRPSHQIPQGTVLYHPWSTQIYGLPVRPGLSAALRLSKSRQTVPATAGLNAQTVPTPLLECNLLSGASKWGRELYYTSGSNGAMSSHRSTPRQGMPLLKPLTPGPRSVGRSALLPFLVHRGSAPATPTGPTTCLAVKGPALVTGVQLKEFRQTPSHQSHQIPVWAGLVNALALQTDWLCSRASPCACPLPYSKPVSVSAPCWHCFPARLFPPLIWDSPSCLRCGP